MGQPACDSPLEKLMPIFSPIDTLAVMFFGGWIKDMEARRTMIVTKVKESEHCTVARFRLVIFKGRLSLSSYPTNHVRVEIGRRR